jgi:hypothetical protein
LKENEYTYFLYFATMKLTCLILLFLSTSFAFAQKTEKFYNYNWAPTDIAHARFYSVLERTDSGWHRLDYYIHGPFLQMEGWFEDSACKTGSGKFVYVYPGEKVESAGRYLHGKKQGLWLRFYPTGLMKDSTVYDNGHPIGTSLGWHANGYSSDSCVYKADGSGVEVHWFDNGNPSSAGMLGPGSKKHGKWQFFHQNGHLSALELYDQGKLLEKQYYDESGQPMTDTTNKDRSASFVGGTKAWLKYLGNHLNWPTDYKITNSDEAAVVVTLTVDEDGKIRDTYIRTPFYPPFEKIALDAIRRSPKWLPAMDHNRRVSGSFSQPVVFSQPQE